MMVSRRRRSWIFGLVAVFLGLGSLAGCADSGGDGPGWSIGDDVGFGQADVDSPDAVADVGTPDISPDADGAMADAACTSWPSTGDDSTRRCAPQEASVFYFSDLGRNSGAPRLPIVMGDSVYFQRDYGDTIAIMAQRIGSGENRIVYESEDYLQLEAAAGGRLLTSINERDGLYNAVHVRDIAGYPSDRPRS
jgi:hypothetical protein